MSLNDHIQKVEFAFEKQGPFQMFNGNAYEILTIDITNGPVYSLE
jgi:hypothetical protein